MDALIELGEYFWFLPIVMVVCLISPYFESFESLERICLDSFLESFERVLRV